MGLVTILAGPVASSVAGRSFGLLSDDKTSHVRIIPYSNLRSYSHFFRCELAREAMSAH